MHRGKLKAACRPFSCSQLEIFFVQSDPSAYMDSSGSHQHGEAASQIHAPLFFKPPRHQHSLQPTRFSQIHMAPADLLGVAGTGDCLQVKLAVAVHLNK